MAKKKAQDENKPPEGQTSFLPEPIEIDEMDVKIPVSVKLDSASGSKLTYASDLALKLFWNGDAGRLNDLIRDWTKKAMETFDMSFRKQGNGYVQSECTISTSMKFGFGKDDKITQAFTATQKVFFDKIGLFLPTIQDCIVRYFQAWRVWEPKVNEAVKTWADSSGEVDLDSELERCVMEATEDLMKARSKDRSPRFVDSLSIGEDVVFGWTWGIGKLAWNGGIVGMKEEREIAYKLSLLKLADRDTINRHIASYPQGISAQNVTERLLAMTADERYEVRRYLDIIPYIDRKSKPKPKPITSKPKVTKKKAKTKSLDEAKPGETVKKIHYPKPDNQAAQQ